jgi:hypothetical protein
MFTKGASKNLGILGHNSWEFFIVSSLEPHYNRIIDRISLTNNGVVMIIMMQPENGGYPQFLSILIGCSHPFWVSPFMEPLQILG